MRSILVTGAAGFIGSNFVRMLLESGLALGEDLKLVALDKLTYAGNLQNLADLLKSHQDRLVFIKADICDAAMIQKVFADHEISQVVHFAAESHVDRSIHGAGPFIQTNIVGTQVLLEAARVADVKRYVQVSTDEVYGTLPEDGRNARFTEETPIAPNSPYSASKAAGDLLARAAFQTFSQPVIITRCSNNYGPYHFPEKMIPLAITNLMEGKPVPLYGDGMNIRDWLYVLDHCEAIWAVLQNGQPGEVYNIGGDNELTNKALLTLILEEMGKPWDGSTVRYVTDRPGHDRRYAIDASKIKKTLGWEPRFKFESAIRATIQWYREHDTWWKNIRSGAYTAYYEKQYAHR